MNDPTPIDDDTVDSQKSPTPEQRLWRALRGRRLHGWKFRRAFAIGGATVAFACIDATLVIELDSTPGEARSDDSKAKTRLLEKAGFKVIRFTDVDVMTQFEKVMQTIYQAGEPRIFQKPKPAVVGKKKTKPKLE